MAERNVRIAHISDLHFTSQMSWPPPNGANDPWAAAFAELRRDLKAQKPHLIVVTGDIANNNIWELRDGGLEKAWKVARTYLEELAGLAINASKPLERLFVIPGNHDLKLLGNISKEELRRIVGSTNFRMGRWLIRKALNKIVSRVDPSLEADVDVLTDPNVRDALQNLETDQQAFEASFAPFTTSRFIPELDLYVLGVNSNVPNDPLTNFAQGAVSSAEAKRLYEVMDEWRRNDPSFERRYKIVLIHHHPMPIPLSEGIGGVMERDQFHLLRNAGNFMRFCVDNGVDFVLHGHKHAQGYSVVSLPASNATAKQSVGIIGAGSVHVPFSDACSYNVLTRKADRSWEVDLRSRQHRKEGISSYGSAARVLIASPEEYRRREWQREPFPITIHSMDILAVVDPRGDLRLNFSAKRVRPLAEDEELTRYPMMFSAESRRAAIEDVSFEDENPRPNELRGVIKLDRPATRHNPQDVEFKFTGVGMVTFSQEYCRWYKDDKSENFSFGIGKQYEALNVEVEFPDDFPPRRPHIEVLKILDPQAATEDKSIKQLRAEGAIEDDVSETEYCREKLRAWANDTRLSFHVDYPLPYRYYRILWDLPTDEFEILPDGPEYRRLRSLTRAAIKRFRETLIAKYGSHERECVRAFLEAVGDNLLAAVSQDVPIRLDFAVQKTQSTGKEPAALVSVVSSVVRQPNKSWAEMPELLECALGETLRGRAYLERRPVFFGPGEVDNIRNPARHPHDEGVLHQIGIPLLWPPEPPFYPRLGVLTISCYQAGCDKFFETLTSNEMLDIVSELGHQHVQTLARDLHCPLPEYE